MNIMGKETNLNTILIAICLGVMSWVGYKTSETGEKVSAINVSVVTNDRELFDLRTRVAHLEIEFAAFKATQAVR